MRSGPATILEMRTRTPITPTPVKNNTLNAFFNNLSDLVVTQFAVGIVHRGVFGPVVRNTDTFVKKKDDNAEEGGKGTKKSVGRYGAVAILTE